MNLINLWRSTLNLLFFFTVIIVVINVIFYYFEFVRLFTNINENIFIQIPANSGIAVNNNNKVNRLLNTADNTTVTGSADSSTWDVILTNPTTTITPAGITPPPPTQINKLQISTAGIRKDKRRSSSRFNISSNRELIKLPHLKGKECYFQFNSLFFLNSLKYILLINILRKL